MGRALRARLHWLAVAVVVLAGIFGWRPWQRKTAAAVVTFREVEALLKKVGLEK